MEDKAGSIDEAISVLNLKGGDILDVASGKLISNHYLHVVAELHPNIRFHAIDAHAPILESASNIYYSQKNLFKYNSITKFDIVSAFGIYLLLLNQSFREGDLFMRKMNELLKRGGILVFNTFSSIGIFPSLRGSRDYEKIFDLVNNEDTLENYNQIKKIMAFDVKKLLRHYGFSLTMRKSIGFFPLSQDMVEKAGFSSEDILFEKEFIFCKKVKNPKPEILAHFSLDPIVIKHLYKNLLKANVR